MKPFVTLALLVLSLLAVPPGSAEGCEEAAVQEGDVNVYARADCTVEVILFEHLDCVWGSQSHTVTAGPATVTYYYCVSPNPPPAAALACEPVGLESAILAGSRVELHGDCTVDVVLLPEIICAGPWGGKLVAELGPVYVEASHCGLPIDDTS